MDIKIRATLLGASLTLLILVIGTARADDTDIYLNGGAPPGSEPMVIFSLDYRPNLASTACNGNECDTLIAEGYLPPSGPYTFFDVLRAAFRKVFDPISGVKVGFMMNHDNRNGCAGFGKKGCSNGGYIARGLELFDDADSEAKESFFEFLDAIPTPQGNVSHKYQGKELFFELFRYLTGQGVYNGHNGYTDYGTSNKFNLDVDNPAIAWDAEIESGPTSGPVYSSPLTPSSTCARIFTVNILFQVSQQEDDSDTAIAASVASGGMGSGQDTFPDVIRYLHDADLGNGGYGAAPDLDGKQNVLSYFLVDPSKINTTTTGYAQAGGTGVPLALSEDPDELVATLQEILRQILSVSTTFVAASVPVNVFNRAEITDNVFIALFQVNASGKPSWVGNLKKLKLSGANDASSIATLVDATETPAVAADGRLRYDALTHWTQPAALPPPDLEAGEVAGRDGRAVARGGAGQKIPGGISGSPMPANGLGGRTIYYDRTPTSLANFNVDAPTGGDLKLDFEVATTALAEQMIAYARGLDIDDLDGDSVLTEARDWIFGDALHSRPLPINYGSLGGYGSDNPAIFIAVASNDGMLRLIRNTTMGGAQSGEEVWAFLPRNSMLAQKVLRTNGPSAPHPYTLDGAPAAYIEDRNFDGTISAADGDKVYLYVGMRRGGKAYYALDVTDPESPDLMWTIEKGGDFEELGYTFSTPRVGLVDSPTGPRKVVMFAGGYDMNKDDRSGVGSDDSEGNAIFVVDAETGQLIWKARRGSGGAASGIFEHPALADSIPSTLSAADTDGDGLTDRLLVGDTGGNVWRADLYGDDTAGWKLSLLASVGRHSTGASGVASDRRFFHRPDLVPTKDGDGLFDAVVIGSGDRTDPLDHGGLTSDFLYMIKDRRTAAGSGVDTGLQHADFGDVTDNCLQGGGTCSVTLDDGWRLQMEATGEKVLATPLTMAGKVFFTSYLPQTGEGLTACTASEGAGRLWSVSLQDATSVINYDTSDDEPDLPDEPTTKADRSVILQSLGIPAEVVSVPPNKILRPDLQIQNVNTSTRWRTYWKLQEDADL